MPLCKANSTWLETLWTTIDTAGNSAHFASDKSMNKVSSSAWESTQFNTDNFEYNIPQCSSLFFLRKTGETRGKYLINVGWLLVRTS